MILQASKKQRCFKIEPETGVVQLIDEESSEEAERRALRKLDLWKHADYDHAPSFLSTNKSTNGPVDHSRSLSDSTNTPSIEAIRLKAIENTHKSLMECSLLLSMTGLINNQEFLTLQTCSRPTIQPRGIVLPPGQVVEIRRNEYKSAENVVVSGISAALRVMNERRLFAEGILEIRKNWRILSHSSILANRKNLQSRIVQLDGRERDTLYIDCSYVSSGDKLSSLDQFLVPLEIGPNGPVLGSKEENIICATLKITMKHRLTGQEIASTTAWQMRQIEKSAENSDSKRSSTSTNQQHESETITQLTQSESKSNEDESNLEEIPHVRKHETSSDGSSLLSSISAHCQRRQHDAMSRRLFAKLRKAAVDDNDRLIIQSNNNMESSLSFEHNAVSKEINNLNALFDSELTGSLEVTIVRKGCIEINLSGNMFLLITLEPIPKPCNEKDVCTVSFDGSQVVDTPCVRSARVGESQNEEKNVPMDMQEEMKVDMKMNMKMDIDDTGDSVDLEESHFCGIKWIQDLFSRSLMKAQLLLLEHWSSSKEAEIEKEKIENAAATAATAAATVRSASELKIKSIAVTNTKITSTPHTQPILPNSKKLIDSKIEFKVHRTDIYSDSLSGINILKRLINPVLKSKVRDVGDGIAMSLDRSTDDASKKKETSVTGSSSHYDEHSNTMGSVSGRILLGLLDVIRCGLQKYRVFCILKSLKQDVCTDLNVSVRYDYFPSKMKKKISNTLQNGEIDNESRDTSHEVNGESDDNGRKKMIKIETGIKEEKEGKEIGEDKMGKEEKEAISGDDNSAPNTDLEKDKMTEMMQGTEAVVKEEVKEEVKDEKTNTIIEDVKKKLLKAKKEKEEKIRTVKKDFMNEFLLSETAEFFVTLPDCCLLISATSRYGFQLKSVIFSEAVDRFPSFMEHHNNNEGVADVLKTVKMNETETILGSSKHAQRHCDSLYHPMSVRLDRTQELVRSLDCLVMGSCVSWALRDVRDVSSLYVTQISSTFFSLHHHSMPPHTAESHHNTAASDTAHDVAVNGGDASMSGDNVDSTFKLHTPLSISHGFSHSDSDKDKEKEKEYEGCSDKTINTRMATIRVQQSNPTNTKNTDNHHHNARDKKYEVDVEFTNSLDYNSVHTKMRENPNFLNESETRKLQTENCDEGDFQKMKIRFLIGPEIDYLRIFVTSLCSAYPKH